MQVSQYFNRQFIFPFLAAPLPTALPAPFRMARLSPPALLRLTVCARPSVPACSRPPARPRPPCALPSAPPCARAAGQPVCAPLRQHACPTARLPDGAPAGAAGVRATPWTDTSTPAPAQPARHARHATLDGRRSADGAAFSAAASCCVALGAQPPLAPHSLLLHQNWQDSQEGVKVSAARAGAPPPLHPSPPQSGAVRGVHRQFELLSPSPSPPPQAHPP